VRGDADRLPYPPQVSCQPCQRRKTKFVELASTTPPIWTALADPRFSTQMYRDG
jgi:uncharacterized OB-fold protein